MTLTPRQDNLHALVRPFVNAKCSMQVFCLLKPSDALAIQTISQLVFTHWIQDENGKFPMPIYLRLTNKQNICWTVFRQLISKMVIKFNKWQTKAVSIRKEFWKLFEHRYWLIESTERFDENCHEKCVSVNCQQIKRWKRRSSIDGQCVDKCFYFEKQKNTLWSIIARLLCTERVYVHKNQTCVSCTLQCLFWAHACGRGLSPITISNGSTKCM